eukprot:gene6024-6634_t
MAGHHPLPSRRLWAILLLFSAALSNAFSFSLQHGPSLNRKEVFLRMSSKDMHKQLFKSLTAAAVLSTAFNFASPSLANPTISLEESVQALEKAQQRSDTLSAMASVYEASQEKTLLARARYKYRIVSALNEKRVQLNQDWDSSLSFANGELKRRVDPLRTVDLSSYLKVAPFVGGGLYLSALFVQQALPELFILAYPLAAVAFFAPIVFIVLTT